jgi:steroid delta-isomerase-like uncharacterized protein
MSNVELHQGAHRAMSDEGAEQAAAFFAPDIVFTDFGRGLTMKGKDETTGWLAGWKTSFPDARITEATYHDAGEWTIAQFVGRGVNDGPLGDLPPTGKELDLPCCEVIRWQDGKAQEGSFYYDSTTIMVQMGHIEAPM